MAAEKEPTTTIERQPEDVAAEVISQAEEKTELAHIDLMDSMEKSVPRNGPFFVKIGQRADPPPWGLSSVNS